MTCCCVSAKAFNINLVSFALSLDGAVDEQRLRARGDACAPTSVPYRARTEARGGSTGLKEPRNERVPPSCVTAPWSERATLLRTEEKWEARPNADPVDVTMAPVLLQRSLLWLLFVFPDVRCDGKALSTFFPLRPSDALRRPTYCTVCVMFLQVGADFAAPVLILRKTGLFIWTVPCCAQLEPWLVVYCSAFPSHHHCGLASQAGTQTRVCY